MVAIPIDKPEVVGFDVSRLDRAWALLERWTTERKVLGAGMCVGRRGRIVEPRIFGHRKPGAGAGPLGADSLFLIASITKPVTAMAVMMLVERGLLTLEDRVATFVPRFAAHGKHAVQVRHLLTHTSGLPDMPTDNLKLRQAHKPLSAFIDAICEEKLLFPPGTRVSYQSTGIAMLADIVHQLMGVTLAQFLRKEVFDPLGMGDTSLGWQPAKKERIAPVHLSEEADRADWQWNSPYWLGLGAPWGGMITSPADFARFCVMMLQGGRLGDVRLLAPLTVRAMTSNQLAAMPQVPEEERRCRPWGLGWRLNWPAHSANFGDLLGPRTYGHWGATGTLCWLDPDSESFCVLFTTEPQEPEGRFLARMSNAVCAALV